MKQYYKLLKYHYNTLYINFKLRYMLIRSDVFKTLAFALYYLKIISKTQLTKTLAYLFLENIAVRLFLLNRNKNYWNEKDLNFFVQKHGK